MMIGVANQLIFRFIILVRIEFQSHSHKKQRSSFAINYILFHLSQRIVLWERYPYLSMDNLTTYHRVKVYQNEEHGMTETDIRGTKK